MLAAFFLPYILPVSVVIRVWMFDKDFASTLRPRLRGGPCPVYGSNLKLQVADGNVRYPDGMVVCSPLDRTETVVYGPVIVFEILSPSMAANDRIAKAREY